MKKEPKFLKIMRISAFLLFLCVFSSFAAKTSSQNAKVNINGNNLTIGQFIDQVEKQTDYLFVYSKSEVNTNESVTIKNGNKSVAQYLNDAFNGSDIKYAFENDYIVLTKNASPKIAQQGKKITGVIVDANGEAVIGANVVVKGTTNGTITDFDGNFSIENIPSNAILQVSYIGYLTKEMPVGNQSSVKVTLTEDSQALDEVVVVGYGTMRKSDVTGSIGVAKGEELTKNQNFSALDNLRGKVSGVNIFSNSSQPGAYSNRVIIRGMATINASSNPLYVVDGVVMEDFSLLNPNDIESMEVLKDASAAAIYGARGANGVIMVTTKRGKKGGEGVQISYQGSVSASQVARYMDLLNAQEWTDAFMIGLENENKYQDKSWSLNRADWFNDRDYFDANGNPLYDTDWQKESTRTAVSHNHQLNIQQAGKNSSVGAFLNYTDQQGVVLNTYNKRLNAKVAYDAKPTPWLSTAVNVLVNHTWGQYTPEDGGGQEARRTMIEMIPWYPVKDKMGDYTVSNSSKVSDVLGFEGMSNPVFILEEQRRMRYNTQIFGNAALTFHLAEGLDLKTQFGIDTHNKSYRGYSSVGLNNISKPNGWAEYETWNSLYWQEETYLTYNKVIGDHRINAMAGLSWQERTYRRNKSRTEGFVDDFYEDNNMAVGTTPGSPESEWNRWAMNSYFLRLAYTYKDRYSATVTARVDGSSKFGENNKYAFFPSAGLAWNISQEDFLKDSELISNLKLHTSYGLTGNSEIDPYQSLARTDANTHLLNGVRQTHLRVNKMGNPDLKWERTAQFDAGINLGLFRNRLNFDISYYMKKTTDLLLDCPVPHSSGYETIYKNIGSVRNQGLDLMINGTPIQNKEFSWNSTLSMNFNKNEVLALGVNNADVYMYDWVSGGSILRVGESMGSFYGYVREGVYTIEDFDAGKCEKKQIGRAKRSAEKKILGKGLPDWTGSFVNTFNYKGFDLTLDFQFVWGVDTWQRFYHSTYDRFGITNGLSNILYDAYDGTNPGTMEQMIYLSNSGHAGQDSMSDSSWLADGSYLRLNLIQLGYNFAPNICQSIGLSGLRVYGSVNNAFTLTSEGFNGFDPESSSETGQFGQNMTFFSYPRARTYTFGVNVTF